MPKMNGFLVCKALKQFEAPPKVILLTTGYTKPMYKWEAITRYGADDMIPKPFGTFSRASRPGSLQILRRDSPEKRRRGRNHPSPFWVTFHLIERKTFVSGVSSSIIGIEQK
jgi:hypothetical protein